MKLMMFYKKRHYDMNDKLGGIGRERRNNGIF